MAGLTNINLRRAGPAYDARTSRKLAAMSAEVLPPPGNDAHALSAATLRPGAVALSAVRFAIDQVDDGMVHLFAARLRLAAAAGLLKRGLGRPQCDAAREHRVRLRARRLAQRHQLESEGAMRLMSVLINEAHRHQSNNRPPQSHQGEPRMSATPAAIVPHLLRLLPPPRYWRPLFMGLPAPLREQLVIRALGRTLRVPAVMATLGEISGRRIGIQVTDLGIGWVLELHDNGIRCSQQPAETTISGSATDLLQLASREQDADSLFFQRRLSLTGDTELGLMLRNLLDRLPWEAVPLAQRIVLQRAARLLGNARAAYRS